MKNIMINELKDNLKNVEIKYYVPIREQLAMIRNLVPALVIEDEFGVLKCDNVNFEICKIVSIVDLFTNIEITGNDLDNYDYIMESKLWEKLYDNVFIGDYVNLLEIAINDKLSENSYENILSKKSSDFIKIIDDTMNHVNNMIDKGDPNIIAKYLSKAADSFVKKMPDFSQIDLSNKLKRGK